MRQLSPRGRLLAFRMAGFPGKAHRAPVAVEGRLPGLRRSHLVLQRRSLALAHEEVDAGTVKIDGVDVKNDDLIVWASVAKSADLPATVIPFATSRGGRPIGVQIIGPFMEDLTAIRLGVLAGEGGLAPSYANVIARLLRRVVWIALQAIDHPGLRRWPGLDRRTAGSRTSVPSARSCGTSSIMSST